jgi:hypothetical protein
MDLSKKLYSLLICLPLPFIINAQYAYFPNDLSLLEDLGVKQERIRYFERLGDTSVFETNIYDEQANLIEYKSKENMPIQAKIIFHYNEKNLCTKVDYYRNHILYQYKEIKHAKNQKVERFYSVTGKYKGLEQRMWYNDQGQEVKLLIKRKGHPKLVRKYSYHKNGNLKEMWLKKGGKPTITKYDQNGDLVGADLQDIPRKIIDFYDDQRAKIEQRVYKVSDILPEEIVKIGTGYQEEYEMHMYTHYFPNGLIEFTQICIEDQLMYSYFFDYTFHDLSKDKNHIRKLNSKDLSIR